MARYSGLLAAIIASSLKTPRLSIRFQAYSWWVELNANTFMSSSGLGVLRAQATATSRSDLHSGRKFGRCSHTGAGRKCSPRSISRSSACHHLRPWCGSAATRSSALVSSPFGCSW